MPEQVPPHDIQKEACALGCMILAADAVPIVRGLIGPAHYYRPAHAKIHAAIAALADRGEPVDLVSLRGELDKAGELAAVGGMDYLTSLVDVPDVANAGFYAREVRGLARLRAQSQLFREGWQEAMSGRRPASEIHADMAGRLLAMETAFGNGDAQESPLQAAVREVLAQAADAYEHPGALPVGTYETGFREIDAATHGLRPGHVFTVAAYTGGGKTAWALNAAIHAAKAGAGVLTVSAEMTAPELAKRFLQPGFPG